MTLPASGIPIAMLNIWLYLSRKFITAKEKYEKTTNKYNFFNGLNGWINNYLLRSGTNEC